MPHWEILLNDRNENIEFKEISLENPKMEEDCFNVYFLLKDFLSLLI